MTRFDRLLAGALFALLLAAPLLSAHAIFAHLGGAAVHREHLPIVAALAAIAALPLAGLVRATWETVRAARLVSAMGPFERRRAGGHAVLVFDGPQVAFFTAGVARPAIYLSSAAYALPEPVRDAGVSHEVVHQAAHDPGWRFILRSLELAFPFAIVRREIAAIVARSEFRADALALEHGAVPTGLFDAIVLASTGSPAVGLSGVSTIDRLRAITGDRGDQPAGFAIVLLVPALALVLMPVAAHLPAWLTSACV